MPAMRLGLEDPSDVDFDLTTAVGNGPTVVIERDSGDRTLVPARHATWRPVRDEIAESWRRSEASGLTTGQLHVPFDPDVDRDGLLVRAARPVVEQLSADLRDARMSIVLSDARGHVVDRRIVDERLRSRLDRVSLAPGFIYAEAVVGTNAIGTALVTRKAVAVEGDEHYVEALTAMAGAAAPIADPRSGHVLGVIDLTCCAEDASVLLLSFARRAARDVEQRLVDDVGLPEGVVLQRSLRDRRPPMSDGCWNSPPRDGGRPAEPWGRLNGTEGRVAELVSRGLTNREVAGRLFMSQHTVGYHLRSIFRKFGVSSRVDLTRVALEARQAGPALVYRASRNVTTASTRRWSSSSS